MSDPSRLFLITPPLAEAAAFAPLLEAAVSATDVACVLLRLAARDSGDAKAIVRALAPIAQRHGAAVLVPDDPRLAVRAEADGVHLSGDGAALAEALAALQPDRIVGIGALADRDAAMQAGEAGVDYVMFGGPDADEDHAHTLEQAQWWAEIFNVPCIVYAQSPAFVAELAATGAEFVALCEGLWDEPDSIATKLRGAERALTRLGEPAR